MATNQAILDRLDDLMKRTEELIKLQSTVGQIDKVVCEHDVVLYGKDHDNGIVTELPMIKETIAGIKKLGWIIVTALVGGIIALGFTFVEVARALK